MSAIGVTITSEIRLLEVDSKGEHLDRELLIASKKFAVEHRWTSWWHLFSTLAAIFLCCSIAAFAQPIWLRLAASIIAGLTIVRMFIVYHDYQHNSILRGSKLASFILSVYGHLLLTPPSVWKRSHDHHHKNNSKLFGASIGSFPIMTTTNYAAATPLERFEYRLARNPMIIVAGYFTVFMLGMCVRPLFVDPKRHWDAVLSLVLHIGLVVALTFFFGAMTMVLAFLLPAFIATSAGAYLFYAQHNFPAAKIRRSDQWSYTKAALQSSSFLKMGAVMNWMTGNIGYHHVHHLNAKIPFYRLPEAMAGLEELQDPKCTSLSIKDISDCLSLKLWDPSKDRFVTFREAEAA